VPDFLGKGLNFPLFDSPSVGTEDELKGQLLHFVDGEDKIRQSIHLILATAPGERVMRPDFGCGIHDLLFEPVTPALHALLIDRVTTGLLRWEPRIDILQVDVREGARPQQLLLDVTYRVRANNAVNNMVYPFYLREGVA